MKKIRIAVADDQTMFRAGLVNMLNDIENVEVVAEASDGQELIMKLRTINADVVFLDYRMPIMNGIQAAKIIRDKSEETRILILSMYDEEEFIVSAIENGANGYLTKDDEIEEIQRAIESVISTGYYLNDRTSKLLITNMVTQGKVKPKFNFEIEEIKFSQHEIQVMRLLAKEYNTKEIGEIMVKSDRTIDGYRAEIMEKTGAKNSVGIVMYGVKNGFIDV